MNQKPGEVWLADLGLAARRAQWSFFPATIRKAPRALVIYAPLTTQNRGSRYEVDVGKLPFLTEQSIANVQGVASLPPIRFERQTLLQRSSGNTGQD